MFSQAHLRENLAHEHLTDTASFVVFGSGAQPLKVGFHSIYDTYILPAGSLLQKVQGDVVKFVQHYQNQKIC